MRARTNANTSAITALVMGMIMFGALTMAAGPVVDNLQYTAAGNPKLATIMTQTIGTIQFGISMMKYIMVIISVMIVILVYWQHRQGQGTASLEPASPEDPRRFAPGAEPVPVQAVREERPEEKEEEKKPKKRDRYEVVKV